MQICAFAQEPIFSSPSARSNFDIWMTAVKTPQVDVVGSTPYVEDSDMSITANFEAAMDLAIELGIDLDLHLDYNLDSSKRVIAKDVVEHINDLKLRQRLTDETFSLGHCTRLTLISKKGWLNLASTISSNALPIHFVGLPTSDLFIQGKPSQDDGGGERPRGTLQIPQMIQSYGLNCAIAINNVGNAFTPHGSCDPLALASWCVGVYQAGTEADTQCLFECVSSRAKEAIGYKEQGGIRVGAWADLVIYGNVPDSHKKASQQRPRLKLQDLVYDPPRARQTLFRGFLIDV